MVHGVESSVVSDPAFYTRMLAFVQPQLEFLGPIIAEHYARKMVGYGGGLLLSADTPGDFNASSIRRRHQHANPRMVVNTPLLVADRLQAVRGGPSLYLFQPHELGGQDFSQEQTAIRLG